MTGAAFPVLQFAEGGWCDALGRSYAPGYYHAKTREEYEALAPFAVDAAALEPERDDKPGAIPASAQRDKKALVDWAKEAHGLDIDPESGTKAELITRIEAEIAAKQ